MNEKPQLFESYKINHVCNKLLFLLPQVARCENCTGLVTRLLTAWEVIAILLSMNESYDCPTDSNTTRGIMIMIISLAIITS